MRKTTNILAIVGIILVAIGAIILTVSILCFSSSASETRESFTKDLDADAIEAFDIELADTTLRIVEGDEMSLTAAGVPKGVLNVEITENGVLKVSEAYGSDNYFDLWGWKVPATIFDHVYNRQPVTLTLTVPSDYVSQYVQLGVDCGRIESCALTTGNAIIQVGAGCCEIESITCQKSLACQVVGGMISIENFDTEELEIRVAAGCVKGKGVSVKTPITDAGAGRIELELE